MVFIPFPGKGSDPWVLGGNLAQYIDNLLFKGHMWTPDFDPEGLLSTVPAVVHVLFGYLAGDWIRSQRDTLTKTNGLFIAANAALVAGFLWAQWMPLNKQLWTSSYVLVTTGIALHFLSVSFWLMDVKGLHRFTRPFIIFGSNAILVYVLSSLTAKTLIRVWQWESEDAGSVSAWSYSYDRIFQPVFGNAFGSLMMALVFVSFWLGMMTILYRKRVFIKI
jgi:predicted acyltransferase